MLFIYFYTLLVFQNFKHIDITLSSFIKDQRKSFMYHITYWFIFLYGKDLLYPRCLWWVLLFMKVWKRDWSDSTVCWVFTLHTTDLGSIASIPYVISELRARSYPWLLVCAPTQKKKRKKYEGDYFIHSHFELDQKWL